MDFSIALVELKQNSHVARKGWNGKGMYVKLLRMYTHTPIEDGITFEPFFVIKNVKGKYNTWVPSISDLLAEDWEVIKYHDPTGMEDVNK